MAAIRSFAVVVLVTHLLTISAVHRSAASAMRHQYGGAAFIRSSTLFITKSDAGFASIAHWRKCRLSTPRLMGRRQEQSSLFVTLRGLPDNQNLLSLHECLYLAASSRRDKNEDTNVRFVDASWYHKGDRNGRQEFEKGPRIANSAYFDIDDIKSPSSDNLSYMIPKVGLLKAWMKHHNIQYGKDHIVVYARQGCAFAPRIWFTFSQLGHERVSLMQASLEEWIEQGGPIDTLPVSVARASDVSTGSLSSGNEDEPTSGIDTIDLNGMKQIVMQDSSNTVILDARGSSFAKGHMPGAISVPYSSLSEPDNTLRLKSKEQLLALFREAGVDPLDESKSIVCTCGSGVSACSLYLALRECGRRGDIAVYDGSWQEWGSIEELPKVLPECVKIDEPHRGSDVNVNL